MSFIFTVNRNGYSSIVYKVVLIRSYLSSCSITFVVFRSFRSSFRFPFTSSPPPPPPTSLPHHTSDLTYAPPFHPPYQLIAIPSEIGINPSHILAKSLTVLNPLRRPAPDIMDDADLAGPFVFCFGFALVLLLVRTLSLFTRRR